jgi:hypothetical protein
MSSYEWCDISQDDIFIISFNNFPLLSFKNKENASIKYHILLEIKMIVGLLLINFEAENLSAKGNK